MLEISCVNESMVPRMAVDDLVASVRYSYSGVQIERGMMAEVLKRIEVIMKNMQEIRLKGVVVLRTGALHTRAGVRGIQYQKFHVDHRS